MRKSGASETSAVDLRFSNKRLRMGRMSLSRVQEFEAIRVSAFTTTWLASKAELIRLVLIKMSERRYRYSKQ